MTRGWRSRIHYWSRHRGFLIRTALTVAATGFVIASVIVVTTSAEVRHASIDPAEQQLRHDWQQLRHASEARPRDLARWLRRVVSLMPRVCMVLEIAPTTWEGYLRDGRLAGYDARAVIQKHAGAAGQAALMEDFLAAQLPIEAGTGKQAAQRLAKSAAAEPPPPLANELHASVLLRQQRKPEALRALMREGTAHQDAAGAREDAVRLALLLDDTAALREMKSAPDWFDAVPPILVHHAGSKLHDVGMQWRGLLWHRLAHMPYVSLLLALLAAGLWFVILNQHAARQRWHWARPLLPLMAGVFSVWPTLALVSWQDGALGMTEEAPFPWDLWYYIAGVGLREELCKLVLFSLFLPWLLWRRVPGLALLTGAFVGLGFALEENITYYEEHGGAVVLVRFLSANFLHAALTGTAAHALYDMLRSRFARADQFIIAFAAVIVAHGVYDYSAVAPVEGMEMLSVIILAAIAWQFFDLMARELPVVGQLVSPGALLVLGIAVMIAASFIVAALAAPTMAAVCAAGIETVVVLPVAIIYWRRFEG